MLLGSLLSKKAVLSNVPGALDEFKGNDYLTPDSMYELFHLGSGVLLLASKDLVVDMTEGMFEGQALKAE